MTDITPPSGWTELDKHPDDGVVAYSHARWEHEDTGAELNIWVDVDESGSYDVGPRDTFAVEFQTETDDLAFGEAFPTEAEALGVALQVMGEYTAAVSGLEYMSDEYYDRLEDALSHDDIEKRLNKTADVIAEVVRTSKGTGDYYSVNTVPSLATIVSTDIIDGTDEVGVLEELREFAEFYVETPVDDINHWNPIREDNTTDSYKSFANAANRTLKIAWVRNLDDIIENRHGFNIRTGSKTQF